MVTIDIEDAQGQLADLLAKARMGEEVMIREAGKPACKIGPVEPVYKKGPILLGGARGMFHVPDDFDTMFADEIADMFEGVPPRPAAE